MGEPASLIIAASERDANLYYATRFWAPDAFIFLEIKGKKIMVMSDLELDRAKSEAKVDEIVSYSALEAEAKKINPNAVGVVAVCDTLLKQHGITTVRVPSNFPVALADDIRQKGYTLDVVRGPFVPDRSVKTPEEVSAIRQTQQHVEVAVQAAIDLIVSSEINGDELWLQGKPLTSEQVRQVIHLSLMDANCLAQDTIIAGGKQGCDPHCQGFGVLKPHDPIVLDVFPVSMDSRYFADMTRTVVKGKPSEMIQKMYQVVNEGQEIGIGMIKEGVNGRDVHQAILSHFEKEGFRTGQVNGRMSGFFHGTGHGIGLEIHEPPKVSTAPETLCAGQVVTVEPGLYYPEHGGVRLEDMVQVTKEGCNNLTTFEKTLIL